MGQLHIVTIFFPLFKQMPLTQSCFIGWKCWWNEIVHFIIPCCLCLCLWWSEIVRPWHTWWDGFFSFLSVMILMWTVMMQNEVFQEFDILNGLSTLREIMENSLTKTEVAFIGNVLVFVPYSLPWNHQPFSKNHKLLLLQFYFEVPAPPRISPYFPWIEFS